MPIYASRSVGALFKILLSSHSYILVAKGVKHVHLGRLQHKKKAYDQLRTIKKKHVLVCLGNIDLALPYYYHGRVFAHFLSLDWAGRPLFDLPRDANKPAIFEATNARFQAIHKLHIFYGDAEPRNILDYMILIMAMSRSWTLSGLGS